VSTYTNREAYALNEQALIQVQEVAILNRNDIVKNPNKYINLLKSRTNTKKVDKEWLYALLNVAGIILTAVISMVSPESALMAGLLTSFGIIGEVLNHIGAPKDAKHGNGFYEEYTEEKRDADKIYKFIVEQIAKIDEDLMAETDQSKIDYLNKARSKLVDIKNKSDSYINRNMSREEYYETIGLSASNIDNWKNIFRNFVKNKDTLDSEFNTDGLMYAYLDVPKSKFVASLKRFMNTDAHNAIDAILDDDEEKISKFENKRIISIIDSEEDGLYYCLDNKKFYIYSEGIEFPDYDDGTSYDELKSDALNYLKKKQEAIIADAELGYYRLSEPPKGVTPKKI
jgi:hypothetical protein